jgi:hypothetical protein
MKTYLGDGVYAEFKTNIGYIILTTENGISIENKIYMDSQVQQKFMEFIKKINSDERAIISIGD